MANTAASKGKTPKEFCDENVSVFKKLDVDLQISFDHFIRTTDNYHYEFAQTMFKKALENGDIYLKDYEGWYLAREERFMTETEAKASDYKDSLSGKPLEKQKEPAYFFRMSKLSSPLFLPLSPLFFLFSALGN